MASATINLTVDSGADPEVLARVLSVCRQRRFLVEELHFEAQSASLRIAVRGPGRHLSRLAFWLDRQICARVEPPS